jgi:hypothetical protein
MEAAKLKSCVDDSWPRIATYLEYMCVIYICRCCEII